MDPVTLFAAIPKVALFLLLMVAVSIGAELIYLNKRKAGQSLETPSLTTEVISPAKAPRLSKKTLTAVLIALFLAASIPASIVLVKQRQEIRKIAQGECVPGECCDTGMRCNQEGYCIIPSESCGPSPTPPPPTPTPAPTPSPAPTCQLNGANCVVGGDEDAICCSRVCSYGKCRGDTPGTGCGGFAEPGCWAHNNCMFLNGACVPRTGTPPGGQNVECIANSSGVKIINKSEGAVSGAISWFSSKCGEATNCMCAGQSTSEQVSLGPGASWSRPITGSGCAWQSDVAGFVSCSGAGCLDCRESPPPTPPTSPPPAYGAMCQAYGVYNTSWNPVTNLSTLAVGQTVYFTTRGSTNHPQGITKARFRINGGVWRETTAQHGNEFYIQYTIGSAGSFKIESMVFNPVLGWQ